MEDKSLLSHKPDYVVCTCMCVMYSEVVRSIQAGATSFSALQEQLLVGTGCSSCVQEIHDILKQEAIKVDQS